MIALRLRCDTRTNRVSLSEAIGCLPDTICLLTNANGLLQFASDCYDVWPSTVTATASGEVARLVRSSGPGYWAYW